MRAHLPLILATLLYVWQCGLYMRAGHPSLALTFFAYALANLGLIWTARLMT